MENLRRHFGWAVLVSELGHVFCCVLPTIFTALSFAANIGLIGMAPSWMLAIHEKIHHFEVPIIGFSGVILVMGWAALCATRKVECNDEGCEHGKTENGNIMVIATILFVANLLIYTVIHKNIFHLDAFSAVQVTQQEEDTH